MRTPFDSPRPPLSPAGGEDKGEGADIALCRSALYEALALGLAAPADETVARLASPEGAAALADAADVLDRAWGSSLASHVRGLAVASGGDGLAAAFSRLFGHTARGAVPPYETEYGEDSLFQPMQEMSDLAAFYRAFGLALSPQARERLDHVSCECEFLAVLTRKEAYALEREDTAMLEATQHAARLFLRDHLGLWASGFGRKLARADPGGFYGALGELCHAFVSQECARAGVATGAEFLRLRSASPGDVPMACGPAV
jgi:DMSO reductase family type II enzyme chaperone